VKNYDVIVIGVGSMGSSACYWLAKRGYNVLGLEQFEIPHEQGSHAGQSRIIRKAYFEHPGYVPLLERAYYNWEQLEKQTGIAVYFKTGLLYHGPPGHVMMKGIREAALLYDIEINKSTSLKTGSGYSQFNIPPDLESIYEPAAGFIRPEKAVALYKDEAVRCGAEIHIHETVLEWAKENGGIKVITDKNIYYSKKLIITAGAWAGKMIPGLTTSLKITRQIIVWVKPTDEKKFMPDRFPCWMVADDKREGVLYGFPYLAKEQFGDPGGLKFAWHHPGELTNPDHVNRNITKEEIAHLIQQVAEYIPAVGEATLIAAKTCLYANSSDEDFIIDHLPGFDRDVTIACGFSGHGFKFVSVVGEILADLAMNGQTGLPVDFLGLKRFGKNEY
jgi:sarcosine oxidase